MTKPKYDYGAECLYLPCSPSSAREALIKLDVLQRLEKNSGFACNNLHYSRRRARLVRMYHAFRNKEA